MSAAQKIDVLDTGSVRLVDHMGGDLSIVRSARVSYAAHWRAGEDTGSDARLIRYLMDHGHNTPFESVQFTFEVKAPIFVVRQWHRHRTWSYNEVSARYTQLDEGYYLPRQADITTQSADNKQSRTDREHPAAYEMQQLIRGASLVAFDHYADLLDAGCPRELARMVLPLNTYTRMFATVNLHNLFGFLRERLHPHAQYEIRCYAEAIVGLIRPIVPVAIRAFENTTRETIND